MNFTQWMNQTRRDYREREDKDRHKLLVKMDDAFRVRESDPEKSIELYEDAKSLAQRLDEPWWRMLAEKLRLDALIHFQRDYRDVIDPAARCVLELRKSSFSGFPGRIGVYDTLLSAYLGTDAEGYYEAIKELLDTLERDVPNKPCLERYLVLDRKRIFAVERLEWEEASAIGQRERELFEEDGDHKNVNHFATFSHAALCLVAFERKNWVQLAQLADDGVEHARKAGHHCEEGELDAWRAVAARYAGQDDVARGIFKDAQAQMVDLKMPPKPGYYAALQAYHELAKETKEMLHVRDLELASIVDHGQLLYECRVRIERCKLLARLKRLTDDDVEIARESARKLRFPEAYLKEIDTLR